MIVGDELTIRQTLESMGIQGDELESFINDSIEGKLKKSYQEWKLKQGKIIKL